VFPQSQHNDTVSKLDFVLSLSELVINIARLHMSPLSSSSLSGDQLRRVEQLVLNLHALQLLASSMQLARNELDSSRLQPSSAVRHSTYQPASDVLLQCVISVLVSVQFQFIVSFLF